jgi:3',5'-cyclic AMP phosphodiesterase CpdA
MKYYYLLLAALYSFSLAAEIQTFAVIGDAGQWNKRSESVRDSILASNVRRLILPGDNIYDLTKTYEQVWSPWSSKGLEFDVVAIGNHRKSYQEEVEFFKMPGEYFEKISGNLRFLVLNSDNTKNVDAQITWLSEKMAEPSPLFTIVVFHHPPATISRFHSWQEKENFQKKLRPILIANSAKINAILVGHDHQASLFTFGQIPVIVSGAVWESRAAQAANHVMDGKLEIKTHWVNSGGFYWVRLDLNDEDQSLLVNFIRTDVAGVSCTILLKRNEAPSLRPNCNPNQKSF